jgi:glycosyltransferase involved in cell wall biosynthesis
VTLRVTLVSSLEGGGPVEQALVLAPSLASAGADVRVVCAAPKVAARFAARGIEAEAIPLRSAGDLRGARRVWQAVRGCDVVHAQDRRSGLWTCLGPRPRAGGTRVYTVHGLPEPYLPEPARPEGYRAPIKAFFAYRLLDAGATRRADLVIVPSRAVAAALQRIGYPGARMRVIPNGVEPAAPSEGGRLIGTLSVLEPVKGLDIFLRAAALVAPRRPEARFAIFGAGSERERLVRLSIDLGLDEIVDFPGHVPGPRALSQLGVFVLCSYMENSPMALLEAMSAGVPAIATRVGGVPEIAPDHEVELIEPGDPQLLAKAIVKLLEHPELTARRVTAARERVGERYTASINAEDTLVAYRAALAGSA